MTSLISMDDIHDSVREHYAAHAREGSSCCSGEVTFYAADEIGNLPEDVAGFSLGCGNAVGGAALQAGETVVDLGSGGGLECFIAAQRVGADGRVIGIDMTLDMLEKARGAAVRMGFENVEFREGFIEAIPVAGDSVDVVISNCVINLSPDKPAVIREMYRILKPGGRIAISDVVASRPIPESFSRDPELWSACASGALPVADWQAELGAAGFRDIRIEARTEEDEYTLMIPESRPFSAMIYAVKP